MYELKEVLAWHGHVGVKALAVAAGRAQEPFLVCHFWQPRSAWRAGEEVQWELLDRGELHLVRLQPPKPSTTRRAPKTKPVKPS